MSKAPRSSLKPQSPHEIRVADEVARPGVSGMTPGETAQYVADFTAELSFLARRTKLDLLAYLLDMARMEAIRALQANGKE